MTASLIFAYGSQIYGLLINLIFTPLILYKIGANQFAYFGYFFLGLGIFLLIEVGISQLITKFTAEDIILNDFSQSKSFIFLFVCIVAALIFSVLILTFLFWFFNKNIELLAGLQYWHLIIILCAYFIKLLSIPLRSIMIAFEMMNQVYIANVIHNTFKFPILFSLIIFFVDYDFINIFVISMIISVTLEVIFMYVIVHAKARLIFRNGSISFNLIKSHSEFLWFTVKSTLSWTLFMQSDKIMAGYYFSPEAFGVYTAFSGIFGGILAARNPLLMMFQPKVYKILGNDIERCVGALSIINNLVSGICFIFIYLLILLSDSFLSVWLPLELGKSTEYLFIGMGVFFLLTFLLIPDYLIFMAISNMKHYYYAIGLGLLISWIGCFVCVVILGEKLFYVGLLAGIIVAKVYLLFAASQTFKNIWESERVRKYFTLQSLAVGLILLLMNADLYHFIHVYIDVFVILLTVVCTCWTAIQYRHMTKFFTEATT